MRAVDAPADARRRHLTRESHARNHDAIISPITPRDRRLASSSSRANERAIATAIAIRAVLWSSSSASSASSATATATATATRRRVEYRTVRLGGA